MNRLAAAAALASTLCLGLTTLTPPAPARAAIDTATASIPVPGGVVEVHTTANCVLAENQCHFTASANLLTPEGPTGFPPDLWARQTTTLRSMDKLNYLGDTYFFGENTRMFKGLGPVEFTTIYFGAGPVEKYRISGFTRTVNWRDGQPKTDADYIVCSHIQVVWAGVNLTTPDACAQTTYS
ncbi:hypothetical protein [uncultured Mycolicibacterium sp.]|uniref:hypothetical protein n=1 Tax=uncultured Mycolicibacterium sp. TaxID=2320817 RepID=UPI002611495B|nr:hypothetical protein [uncultured Mycolicibacterium sp.]